MAVFCGATVVFLVYRDLFIPEVRAVEVWFGFEVRGRLALATAPLHWAIFLVGAWGFATARPWITPAAAAYAFVIAGSHLVWNLTSPAGYGLASGLAQALGFSIPGLLLAWAHRRSREAAIA